MASDSVLSNFSGQYQHELTSLADRLRAEGTSTGSANKPLTAAQSLDPHENEVVHQAQKIALGCQTHYEKHLRAQISELEKLESATRNESYSAKLGGLVAGTKVDLDQIFVRERAQLLSLKQEELTIEAAFNSFKQIHKRTEPAHYPPSQKAHYYIIGIIAVVETILNVGFYGEFKGVASAIFIAFLASVIGVVTSIFVGVRWGLKNLPETKHQTIGWGFFGGWILFIFYWNKFLASFRAALEVVANDPNLRGKDPVISASQIAFDKAFSYPLSGFGYLDIISWFLFITGIIVAVTAFLKGYHADDTYPGYGLITRKFKAARQAYLDEENRLRDKATAIVKDAERKISEVEISKQSELTSFNEMSQLCEKRLADYKTNTTSVSADLKFLLSVYRDANKSVRTTPPPAYFSSETNIPIPEMQIPEKWQSESVDTLKSQLARITKAALSFCSTVRKELADLNQENAKQVDSFFQGVDSESRKRLGGIV